ncbi:MAG TPA: hypothetical protein VNG69_02010 [Casimicrobiaceae bacterium]|nr:hypothetical protein [Casimicrobiaceae bacterium]
MRAAQAISSAIFVATFAVTTGAEAQGGSNVQACLAKTKGVYGFHCWGSANFGAGLEPVTFVGTVEGDGRGMFEGYGTANSSLGSVSTHFAGPATFGRHCSGHVDYTTYEIILPDGTVIPVTPTPSFDFATVENGKEILGAGVVPFGVNGPNVPRLACRLVRVNG